MLHDLTYDAVLQCIEARWSPKVGDPSMLGWAAVGCYAVSSFLAMLVAIGRHGGGERVFWAILALGLAALAINKQLDLQSALTAAGRCISQLQGWYADRRGFQTLFILGVLGTCSVLMIVLFWRMRRRLAANWLALLGVSLLIVFVAIRAVGFHHFDEIIEATVDDLPLNWILELGGIVLIALNALWRLAFSRGRST